MTQTFPADFPIPAKWPPRHPGRLQLYSLPTPNGVKISIMLEETGLPYEAHRVDFAANDQTSPEFLSLNPNGRIPAIIDPDGPGGAPLPLFESGAILVYLADKTGRLIPADPAGRYRVLQWVMFQMGGPGPMFGQLGFFHRLGGRDYEDKRPLRRYADEATRLLGVIEGQLMQDQPPGTLVDLLLRPDDVIHDDVSELRAEVVERAFRGAQFRYTLRLPSGATALSFVPSHHDHAIGERIGIRLDAQHLVGFPRGWNPEQS